MNTTTCNLPPGSSCIPEQAFIQLASIAFSDSDVQSSIAKLARYTDAGEAIRRNSTIVHGPVVRALRSSHVQATVEGLAKTILSAVAVRAPSPRTAAGKPAVIGHDEWKHFVNEYVSRGIASRISLFGLQPPLAEFGEEFHRCRRAWESPALTLLVIAPMLHIRPESLQPVQVTSTYRLETKRSHHEAIVEPAQGGMYPMHRGHMQSGAVLRGEITIDKCANTVDRMREAASDIVRALTALRLVLPGHYGTDCVIITAADDCNGTCGIMNWIFDAESHTPHGWRDQKCVTVNASVQSLCDRIIAAWNSRKLDRIKVAIERFNWSFARAECEDQLIDLTIALENTLLHDQDKQELRYRLAIRGTALLRTMEATSKVFRQLREMYDARSSVVHGGHKLPEVLGSSKQAPDVEHFVLECQDLTRQVLNAVIDRILAGTSMTSLCNVLDAEIIDAL